MRRSDEPLFVRRCVGTIGLSVVRPAFGPLDAVGLDVIISVVASIDQGQCEIFRPYFLVKEGPVCCWMECMNISQSGF